jgi:transcriptional regulator with XRE-family HTH domain
MASKGDGIGKRIGELRSDLGMTLTDFAKMINVSRTALIAYEQETSDPGYTPLKGIAENIDHINLNWLFTGIEPKYLESGVKTSLEAFNEKLRMIEILKRQIEGFKALDNAKEEEIKELNHQLRQAQKRIAELQRKNK